MRLKDGITIIIACVLFYLAGKYLTNFNAVIVYLLVCILFKKTED